METPTTAPGADAGTGEPARDPDPRRDDAAGASRGTKGQRKQQQGDSTTTPDRTAILATLAKLYRHDDIIELRAIWSKGRKRTDAGYFDADHREQLANAAVRLNKAGASVYVPLNLINPQLLSRYCNRIGEYATATATDANVIGRRWMLLDFDPVRPKDTSATDAQLEDSKTVARTCHHALKSAGWPDPIVAESGNGVHLLYPIDLPNDNAARDLMNSVLVGLAAQFDTATVTLDQSVFNAGRITKLYGTVATKGDSTPATPWRLSRMILTPERTAVVTPEQLRAVAPATTERPTNSGNRNGSAFNLDAFLGRLGIEYEKDAHEGRERYKLGRCPFNTDHGKGDAAIFRGADGALGFHCFHNSCAGNGWKDLRTLVDGPRARPRNGSAEDPGPRGEAEGQEGAPEDDSDTLAALPVIDRDAVLIGLIGDIATVAAKGREVSPIAVAAATMTWLGCEFGRDAYLPIGDARHHGRSYLAHVGRSARAGKGEALALLRRIRSEIATDWAVGGILGQMHDGGLSSREGLIALIHDGFKQGKEDVPAVEDKRLLVIEEELANVLAQGRRDGNTLLPALRTAYDGHALAPATKNDRISATAPHICILGAITPGELVARLDTREVFGGTFNRFLWVWAERTGLVPLPPPTNRDIVQALAERCVSAIQWARGKYPSAADTRQAALSPRALAIWTDAYADLRRPLPGDIMAAAAERRTTIALRAALVYALTDQSLVIEETHVRAGIAWAQYGGDTVRYVLAAFAKEDGEADERGAKVLIYLARRDWTARTEIRRTVFGGRIAAKDLDAVLQPLLDGGKIQRREVRRPDNPKVRTEYRLSNCAAHNAHNQQSQGVPASHNARTTAHNGGRGDPPVVRRSAQEARTDEPNNDAEMREMRVVRAGIRDAHAEPPNVRTGNSGVDRQAQAEEGEL